MKKYVAGTSILLLLISLSCHGQNKICCTSIYNDTAEIHLTKLEYRDTCVNDPNSIYVLPILKCFEYSKSNGNYNKDTLFVYNHYRYLLDKVKNEIWNNKKLSIEDILYYCGIRDILEDILYNNYNLEKRRLDLKFKKI